MAFLKRKHGSPRQIGQPFPVSEDPKVAARRNAIGSQELYKLSVKERLLRPVFEKYANKKDWKEPIDAVVLDKREANALAKAIEFFQGVEAEISPIDVAVPVDESGALVHVPKKAYRVTSEGYMG